jgi:hypothetical protein
MKLLFALIVIAAVATVTASLVACNKNKDEKRTSEVSTDIDTLSRFLHLPYKPIAAWWQTTRLGTPDTASAPGPNDWIFDAVLLFDKMDLEAIIRNSKPVETYDIPPEQYGLYENIETFGHKNYKESLHRFLKNHGELEDKNYKATIFTTYDGTFTRIKGTNKLYVTYQTR